VSPVEIYVTLRVAVVGRSACLDFYFLRASTFTSHFRSFAFHQKRAMANMANTIDTTEAPQIIEHMHKSLNFTPYDTKWVPCSARLVCMGISPKAKGTLQVYEMNRGELTLVSETLKPEGLKCGTFGASSIEERHLACGDYKVSG